ncbi:peptidase [Cellulomonas sp. H30R-01]|uniref:peptidase n=1 Tax=Cellulomonas sp. H30R-01 TaxID=2704467 RepID=UPI00138C8987|nr:peptidase [Cellulomonas sp. H30R-01]QHT56873.1 peptidase [Cellulomonas sp. H30R-01]
MSKVIRACATALLVAAAALGVPAVAQAAVSPSQAPSAPTQQPSGPQYGCEGATDEYGAPLPCDLTVSVLTPICDNDVPKLRYAVVPNGTPNTTVTITWINPTGPDVVQSGLPLSGTVLWPGAVVGADGKGADWPGWSQAADGSWVEGDEFDWVRPSVSVNFAVNPEMTTTVAYPPSSPNCATNPPGEAVLASNQVLSATGSNTAPLLWAGAGLLVVGAGAVTAVTLVRRRHEAA